MRDAGDAAGHDGHAVARSLTDPERFEALARRHFDPIYRYLARRVGRQLAEDLAAETFLIAFARRSSFDVDVEDARPWLYGIATNLVRRHARSERRRWSAYERLFQQLGTTEDPSVEVVERVATQEQATRIAAGIATLNQGQRDAVHLVALEQLSYEDAAHALGIPIGTLRSRLARARARLRELAGDSGELSRETLSLDKDRS